MAHKFIRTAYKEDMIKATVDGKDAWFYCDPTVKEFAKKNFTEGDDIEFEYTTKGKDNTIDGYIKKVGGADKPPTSKEKDSSYSNSKYKADPVKSEAIRRQAIGHMASRTLISMQGHVDPTNVMDLLDKLYKKFDELTTK